MTLDRKRIAAVAALEAMGYMWADNKWNPPALQTIATVHAAGAFSGPCFSAGGHLFDSIIDPAYAMSGGGGPARTRCRHCGYMP